ncbi:MAG TPA: energy transducer TonB [Vicinamibacteria bacterium]|nr:energy transducer TonB [Vicinamibacteria bacterium]
MERIDTRQGFLISALVHLGIIMVVASRPATATKSAAETPAEPLRVAQRVFLPPPEVLRRLAPIPPRPAPAPRPPAPLPPSARDRISIGPPVQARQKGPLILRRDEDLTQVPKGRPDAVPQAATPPPPAATPEPARSAGVTTPGSPGLRLPPGLGNQPKGSEGDLGKPGASRPSIAGSLRNFEQRLQQATGPLGLDSGTGQRIAGLFFDPQGADFTVWVNHFRVEVYNNWIMPQPAQLGVKGHVDITFTVDRAGSMTDVRILKSSGTPALDRAAQHALVSARLLPLPSDFAPATLTIQVSFFYNEGPTGS